MENRKILKIGILLFAYVLPITIPMYLLGYKDLAIGATALIIPITLQGFALKYQGEFVQDVNRRLDNIEWFEK